ncbi:MAG TPA: hypothetical protein VF601_06610 [Beijerinckiaceae bacterium]|jgi:uncharacterized membrane protein YhiD involved in acid resistance
MPEPGAPTRVKDSDGFTTAAVLFAFSAVCMAVAAYLYWHGTGKLPWQ